MATESEILRAEEGKQLSLAVSCCFPSTHRLGQDGLLGLELEEADSPTGPGPELLTSPCPLEAAAALTD